MFLNPDRFRHTPPIAPERKWVPKRGDDGETTGNGPDQEPLRERNEDPETAKGR